MSYSHINNDTRPKYQELEAIAQDFYFSNIKDPDPNPPAKSYLIAQGFFKGVCKPMKWGDFLSPIEAFKSNIDLSSSYEVSEEKQVFRLSLLVKEIPSLDGKHDLYGFIFSRDNFKIGGEGGGDNSQIVHVGGEHFVPENKVGGELLKNYLGLYSKLDHPQNNEDAKNIAIYFSRRILDEEAELLNNIKLSFARSWLLESGFFLCKDSVQGKELVDKLKDLNKDFEDDNFRLLSKIIPQNQLDLNKAFLGKDFLSGLESKKDSPKTPKDALPKVVEKAISLWKKLSWLWQGVVVTLISSVVLLLVSYITQL